MHKSITEFFEDKKKIVTILALGILTLFSFFWQIGYKVFDGDQLIYFPAFYRSLDPTLFSRDIIFSQNQFLLFDKIVYGTMHLFGTDLFAAVFFITFALRLLFFYSLYRIAYYFSGNWKFSILIPFFFVAGFRIYGTGMRPLSDILLPRDMGTALNLFSLSTLLYGGLLFSGLILGISSFVHPGMAFPYFLIYYGYLIWRVHEGLPLKKAIPAFLIPAGFAAGLWLSLPHSSQTGLLGVIDSAWFQIVHLRTSYIFLTTWVYPNTSLLYLFASVYFFFLARKELPELKKDQRKNIFLWLLFIVPLSVALLAIVSIDILHLTLPAQLQLGRALLLWKVIFNLLFLFYAYRAILRKPNDFLYNFSLLGIIFSFLLSEKVMLLFLPMQVVLYFRREFSHAPILSSRILQSRIFPPAILLAAAPVLALFAIKHRTEGFFEFTVPIIILSLLLAFFLWWRKEMNPQIIPLPFIFGTLVFLIALAIPSFTIFPGELKDSPLVEACGWIKRNTTKEDLFLTEPFSTQGGAIRLLCFRNVFITKKDGGQALYGRDFALEWKKRYDLVRALNEDVSLLPQIAREYNINYVFSDEKIASTTYPLVFENGKYFIYRLR